MKGKLIVIEGLDGSGKATQSALLQERLRGRGKCVRRISFPDYSQPSSALVKMYLSGEFGGDPQAVNPYAASSFYAVDRYASFQKFWREDYQAGGVIVADRYATSNAIYQMTKLPSSSWEEYLAWMEDYEYHKMQLPRPDLVLYLDMPPAVSQRLMNKRYGGDETKKDIHESHTAFLEDCRTTALYAAQKQGWQVIPCAQAGAPRPVEAIAAELFAAVLEVLAVADV